MEKKSQQAPLLATTIDLHFQNETIEKILTSISNTYQLKFTYLNNDIPLAKKVTVHLNNVPLSQALEYIFRNTAIGYQEIGSQILLKKEQKAPSMNVSQQRLAASNRNDSSGKQMKHKLAFRDLFKFSLKRRPKRMEWGVHKSMKDTSMVKQDSGSRRGNERMQRKTTSLPSHPWQVGFSFSPELTHRRLKGNELQMEEGKSTERGGIGYSLSFTIRKFYTKKVYWQSGVVLMRYAEGGEFLSSKPYLPPAYERPPGFASDTFITYSNKYNYLGIPLLLGYNAQLNEKWSVTTSTGLYLAIYIRQKTTYPSGDFVTVWYPSDYEPNPDVIPTPPELPRRRRRSTVAITSPPYYYKDRLDPRAYDKKFLAFVYSLQFELAYKVKDNASVMFGPSLKYFLSSMYSADETVIKRPYMVGFSIGFLYFL